MSCNSSCTEDDYKSNKHTNIYDLGMLKYVFLYKIYKTFESNHSWGIKNKS